MSRRQNKLNRHSVQIVTKVKPVNPESEVFLEQEIPHKAYGSVYVVVDGGIGKRIQFATNGLKIARNIPIFNQATELAVTDPYVQFYRGEHFQDEEGVPYYSLAEAQSKAYAAYKGVTGPEQLASSHALSLALLHYTDFTGDAPDLDRDDEDDNEERLAYGLPPVLPRDMRNPLEKKINHLNYMMLTDKEFSDTLEEVVTTAVAKIQEQGLWGASEETSEEGFQPESTD